MVEWITANPGLALMLGPIIIGLVWAAVLTITNQWKEK